MHETIIVCSCKILEITEMSEHRGEILKMRGFPRRGARS